MRSHPKKQISKLSCMSSEFVHEIKVRMKYSYGHATLILTTLTVGPSVTKHESKNGKTSVLDACVRGEGCGCELDAPTFSSATIL